MNSFLYSFFFDTGRYFYFYKRLKNVFVDKIFKEND
jgi:hypothetical protein